MMKRLITAIIASYALWLLFSWSVDREHLLLGIPVSCAATVLFTVLPRAGTSSRVRVVTSAGNAVIFASMLIIDMAKAGCFVVLRLARPVIEVRPEIVHVPLTLKSDTGITFLAIAMSLTPGTVTVDIDTTGGALQILSIDARHGKDERTARRAHAYEALLLKICG